MYVADQYLFYQSSDCFDIFINMSSIINHLGEVRPIPPLCTASDYRKTKLSDTLPRVLCLSCSISTCVSRRKSWIQFIQYTWYYVNGQAHVVAGIHKQPSILHHLFIKAVGKTSWTGTSCNVRIWCRIALNNLRGHRFVLFCISWCYLLKRDILMHCLSTTPCPFASQ